MNKFKKGDRVIVIETYNNELFGVKSNMTGTVNEEDSWNPFVKFDIKEANYTSKGTAVEEYNLKPINMKTRTNYLLQERATNGRFVSNKNVSDLKVNQEPKPKRYVEFAFGFVIGVILLVLALDYFHVITLPVR